MRSPPPLCPNSSAQFPSPHFLDDNAKSQCQKAGHARKPSRKHSKDQLAQQQSSACQRTAPFSREVLETSSCRYTPLPLPSTFRFNKGFKKLLVHTQGEKDKNAVGLTERNGSFRHSLSPEGPGKLLCKRTENPSLTETSKQWSQVTLDHCN